ncbi:membrane dipeptidase [Pseudomonas alabamensis]|uniref:membrane dipeptidase n=1 Tax=Pseudomonas alabamensis TaxID=3064349 RepID=UPI003F6546F2
MAISRPRWRVRAILGLLLVLAATVAWLTWIPDNPGYSRAIIRQADALQARLLTFDGHLAVPPELGSPAIRVGSGGRPFFDLPALEKGPVSGAVLSLSDRSPAWRDDGTPPRTQARSVEPDDAQPLARFTALADQVRDHPEQLAFAYGPDDVRRLHGEGRFAVVLGLRDAGSLSTDLDQFDAWAARGMRLFSFTGAGHMAWPDGAQPTPFVDAPIAAPDGLSPLGEQAVTRLNDLGVIIDVSRLSSQALREAARLSRAPLVASRSAPRVVSGLPHDLGDEDLRSIAATEGVVMIPVYAEGRPANASQKTTLRDYGDAIDQAVKTVGIEHVGLSSGFHERHDAIGFEPVGQARNVTAELLRRGYDEADIVQLWGGNFLRVWAQVQRSSTSLVTR